MPYTLDPDSKEARVRKSRQKIADALMEKGSSTEPVEHWLQGAARIGQGFAGGAMDRKLNPDAGRAGFGISGLFRRGR